MAHSRAASAAADLPLELKQGHPAGLWVLFITEMWERFSYYGMRALLVFYLMAKVNDPDNPGLGWAQEPAGKVYAWYTALVYLSPLFGGWLADRMLGTHRSMLIGGWLIAAGHFCLALTEMAGTGPSAVAIFMSGLALIVIGTGFFKPCVSVMVGQLYAEDDPRRDSGFTIFYMGINVGAFLSGIVAGTLGEKVGWHWGFGSAGVGMVLGLIVYQIFRPKFLKGIGLPPGHPDSEKSRRMKGASNGENVDQPLSKVDWDRIWVIIVLALAVIFFWAAFEQAGTSMNVFAKDKTDRDLGGWEFPATWYQSVNPLFIVIFAPIFAWFWVWLERRQMQPRTPYKFALGMIILALGFIFMVIGALRSEPVPVWQAKIRTSDGSTKTVLLNGATGEISEDQSSAQDESNAEAETPSALAEFIVGKLNSTKDGKPVKEDDRPLRKVKSTRSGDTVEWSAEAKIGSAWVPIAGTFDAAAAARTNLEKAAKSGNAQKIQELELTPGANGLRASGEIIVRDGTGKQTGEVPFEGDALWVAIHLGELSNGAGTLSNFDKLSDLKLLANGETAEFSALLETAARGEDVKAPIGGAISSADLIESEASRIYGILGELDYLSDLKLVLKDGRVQYTANVKEDSVTVPVSGDAVQTFVLDRIEERPNAADAVAAIRKEFSGAEITELVMTVDRTRRAGPEWLLLAYLFHTWGELCLSPVGLSMVTKLAAPKIRSSMMGIWFGANFLANLAGGYLFAYSRQIAENKYFAFLLGDADFYLALVIVPLAVGILVLMISPWLVKKMHGLH